MWDSPVVLEDFAIDVKTFNIIPVIYAQFASFVFSYDNLGDLILEESTKDLSETDRDILFDINEKLIEAFQVENKPE